MVSLLAPGAALDAVYNKTVEFIKEKNGSLASKVHTNFGFGIGSKYKEEELSISSANIKTKVEPGMVFHVRITFRDVEPKKSKGPIAIGDTVLVDKDGQAMFLTGGIPRKYAQISYTLDDPEDEKDDESQEGKA